MRDRDKPTVAPGAASESVRRFLAPRPCSVGDVVTLGPGQSRHLSRVLRIRQGEAVCIFTGRGEEFLGTVEAAGDRAARVRLVARADAPGTATDLILAFAPPPGQRADGLIEKATEVGATRLCPLITDRLQGHQADAAARRRERWGRKAQDAARQSGRALVPRVEAPARFDAFVAACQAEVRLIGAGPGAPGLWGALAALARPPASVVVAVGPAGGFTEQELELAAGASFAAVSLGPNVLRVETAAVCMLSAVALRVEALRSGSHADTLD